MNKKKNKSVVSLYKDIFYTKHLLNPYNKALYYLLKIKLSSFKKYCFKTVKKIIFQTKTDYLSILIQKEPIGL